MKRIIIDQPSVEAAVRTWDRLEHGDPVYVSKDVTYHQRHMVWRRILAFAHIRYVSFNPVRMSVEVDLGPPVWFG